MRFTLFDRWGNQTGVVNDVISAIHKDELNGEDSLTLTLASCDLVKGNRIVWRDKFGVWHEHIVNDLKDVHEDGRLYTVAYCESSLAELFTDYIEELRPYDVSATIALQRALSVTRWQIGTVSVQGTGSASFYHISAREALTKITEGWGGEISATIAVSGTQVISRSVNLTSRGSNGGKRFEWSKDVRGIHRDVSSDDVCTALYGYGKGLEAYDEDGNPTGGYERKLTFGDINGGLDYVADEDAKEVWGLPDGNGGKKHTFGKVEFSDCEVMEELLALTRAELQRRKQPQVSYTASVIDLADAGYQFEDVRTGDTVALVDRELGERLQGRVLCVERDLYNESETVITLGNIVRTIHDVIADQLTELGRLIDHSSAWDGAASISDSYINGIIRIWNDTMNATGGYVYQEPGEGITVYDRPEDSNPTMAIQLKGAGFRIANSKTSGGDWNWRTFGTGDGFTADCLNVGTIRGGSNFWNLETGDLLFERGSIRSLDNSSYWNLTTGAVSLSSSATIGGQSVSGVLTDISQLQADLDFTAEQFSVDLSALTTRVGANEDNIASLQLTAQQFSVDLTSTNTTITQMQATYGTCTTAAATAAKTVTCSNFTLRNGAVVTVKFTKKNTAANPTLNVNSTGAKPIFLNGSALPESAYWGAGETVSFIYDGTNWAVTDGAANSHIITNSTEIASLKLTTQQFSVDLQSVNTAIQTTNTNLDTTNGVVTSMQATYATCATAGGTAAKAATCTNFVLRVGSMVTVKFTYKNTAASPTLNVNSTGAKPIALNGSAIPESAYWGAGETVNFIYDGTNWAVIDGSSMAHVIVNSTDIASLKLTTQQFSVDIQNVNTAIQTTNTNLDTTNGVITSMQATYATCSTAGGTTEKAATCSNFVLRNGAMVTVKFTYKNTAANPTLNVNGTGAKAITLNGSAIPESAYWAAGQTMCFVYNGSDWVVTDGATTAQVVTNASEIASLKLTTQQFSVDISSNSESITQLKATYCTCATAAATQEKAATCSGFVLRTGAIVAVKFSYANTVASPTLNVNSTGAKAIYLNGSALPEANWWKANDVVTFVYNGTYWYVADGSTLSQLASTNSNVASLSLRADAFDVSIKGIQATYATCSTAADTQTKEVTIANFTKYVGQTVTVRFTYKNDIASPKLSVQNSDGTVTATGYIYVNGSTMSQYYWWKAGETITFVWDGSYWRVGDGGTMSRIKVLEDSIDLTVTNGSLGNTASIKLSVGDDEITKSLNLTNVRNAFRDDTSQITISAGKVTFNSGTFVVNSTYFSVTSTGVITATSGTVGGFTINSTSIYNDKMTLDSTGLTLKMGSTTVGDIGTNTLVANANAKGLVFDLEYAGYYMSWSVKESSSASYYTMKLAYANKSLAMQSGGAWTAGRLHIAANTDLHGYIAYNFWIDPNTGGGNGGISGTLNFTKITNAHDDGSFNYNNGCHMTFKNGILTSATW